MKVKERSELLPCARRVANAIHLKPANVPVEGYYAEDPQLTEYFLLMRALQSAQESERASVGSLDEFRRLHEVVTSPIFGRPEDSDSLLPRGEDALTKALADTFPTWTIDSIVEAAHARSRDGDDVSLVGLAALAREAVVLAAVRESVVLYAAVFIGSAFIPAKPKYVWDVEEELTARGKRFVATFNGLFGPALPAPGPSSAEAYWDAYKDNEVQGRCVRLGVDDRTGRERHYHWGIRTNEFRKLAVEDFWKDEIWTTARYRAMLFPHESKADRLFIRRGEE